MKIHIESPDLLSQAAKALRKSLFAHGVRTSLSKSYEALAYALGYESLYALQNARHAGPSDPLDQELAAPQVEERRRLQADRLKGYLGLAEEVALAVVNEAQPSGNRRKPPSRRGSELPPGLMAQLSSRLRGKLEYGRTEEPLETIVQRHVLRLLTAGRDTVLSENPDVTVDEYLSRRLPRLVQVEHILNPELLDQGFSSDVVYDWKRKGADKFGWESVREQLRAKLENGLHFFKAATWHGEIRELGKRIAEECGCDVADVADRIRETGLISRIADDLMAELRDGVGTRRVIDLVIRPRNEHGFHEWHPEIASEDSVRAEYWRPLGRELKDRRDIRHIPLKIGGAEVMIEVTRERSHCDWDEGGAQVAFHFFLAKATLNDRVVGLVRGELLLGRTRGAGMSNKDFYYEAESQSGDLTHLAHIILTQHMDADTLFGAGDLLYLSHWEVVPELCGTGFAHALLKGVIDELRRRHKRLASIAYELRPAQFPHPFDRSFPAPVVRAYDQARWKLDRHLTNIGFRHLLPYGHSIRFEVTPEQEAMTDSQRYMTHMRLNVPRR